MSKEAVLMMTLVHEELPMKGKFSQIYTVRVRLNRMKFRLILDNYVESVVHAPKDNKGKWTVATALGDQASVYFANKFSRPLSQM